MTIAVTRYVKHNTNVITAAMTNGSSERLDRIEHLVEKNAEAISQLTARMNQASIDLASIDDDTE